MEYSRNNVLIGTALILMFPLVGCGILSQDYVPSADQIKRSHSEWLIDHVDLKGVNRNMDVDSILFSYNTTSEDSATFWGEIHGNVITENWELIEESDQTRRYQRIIPRSGQRAFHSAEETRVSYKDGHVVVAWVQADDSGSALPTSVKSTGEGKWAETYVWPKFKNLTSGENAR